MIGVTSSDHLLKHFLVVVLCSFSFYSGVNSLSCSDKNSDDNYRCDKIIPGGRRCYLLTKILFGCPNGHILCHVNHVLFTISINMYTTVLRRLERGLKSSLYSEFTFLARRALGS
ncbi:uncharacterized protein LOC134688058 [Mytilus trossulus]|uniref:uncharacterized protein LOC134688058 n=1 Tax=Mytilus trossulus TaxID=6551 RepID=UPI0030041123